MSEPIAIIGGTGDLGRGLGYRWAKAGRPVIIGTRTLDKAETARDDILARVPDAPVRAMENAEAAEAASIVAVTVPFAHQGPTLDVILPHVQGKIVIDTTVCLNPPKVMRVQLPPGGSAGAIAQKHLGDAVRVVSAFQNVPAAALWEPGPVDCDVLVTGNDKQARAEVIDLVTAAGLRGLHAGPIDNAAATEALTSLLIFINKAYGAHAGLRITGVPETS